MNAKILVSLLVQLIPLGSTADVADLLAREIEFAGQKNYRKIDGEVFDLTPRIAYDRTDNIAENGTVLFAYQPLPQFEFIHGRVLSVGIDGVLLRRYNKYDLDFSDDYKVIYVKGFPYQVVDDQRIALYAVESGTYTYASAIGARSTVRQFDFGKTPNDSEITEAKEKAKVKAENYRHVFATAKAIADIQKAEKDDQAKSAAIKFLKEKATEGGPMAQYRLAEKYLKGDGVPIDLDLAKFWLQASCTNGYVEASNLLHKIQSGQISSKP